MNLSNPEERENLYKIKGEYEIRNAHELSVGWNGYNFLAIYGKHKNGWFIAIPNWNVCTEAGEPDDEYCNAAKLAQAGMFERIPSILASAIKEHWESIKKMQNAV